VLERAWQTVSNEFYDPAGHFSQAWWADQLQATLATAGGVLKSQAELDAALSQLLARLGDPYT
jgi:hypothetical protein